MSEPYVGLCGRLHAGNAEPLYLRPTEARPLPGLVSQQAITSPKLGQFTIFSAMRRRHRRPHGSLGEGDEEAAGMERSHVVQRGL